MASRSQTSGEPARSASPLRLSALEPIVRRAASDALAAHVTAALEDAGVPSILLKGPALARWLYRDPGERRYIDVDLLVPHAKLARAEELLAAQGFSRSGRETIPGDWPRHAHNWLHPSGSILDLHYTLFGAAVAPGEVWDVLSARTETMIVGNRPVHVLDEGARALLVALHAWKDGKFPQPRRDLARALGQLPKSVWDDAAVLAARLHALDAFAVGLERDPAGADLARELDLPADRSTGVALRARGAPPLAMGIDWFMATPGWQGKLRLIFRKTFFPPPSFLRDWTPLAEKGVVGLVLAYAWRPLWVLWHIGPAYRAWLRANREARRRSGSP